MPASSGFSLRAAGRTFSFGRKAAQAAQSVGTPTSQKSLKSASSIPTTPLPNDLPESGHNTRPRTHTETSYTSGGTARPPPVLDTKLDFGSSEATDDFENMFEGLNVPRNGRTSSKDGQDVQRAPFVAPPPVRVDIHRQITPAPYSNDSQRSHDGLMTASPQEDSDDSGFQENVNRRTLRPAPRQSTTDSHSRSPEKRSELRRNSGYIGRRKSVALLDGNETADPTSSPWASAQASLSQPEGRKPLPSRDPDDRYSQHTPISLFDGETIDLDDPHSTWQSKPLGTTPKAKTTEKSLLDDPAFRAMAISAQKYNSGQAKQDNEPKKVMTGAQFERYRQQKELERMNDGDSDSGSSSDAYDEEDEEERNKANEKQRKQQEARMSVYRQQMRKVTGDPASSVPQSNVPRAGQSTPNLRGRMSTLSLNVPRSDSPQKVSDEDDEDIPLGILAAHGFPSKGRPPSQLRERHSHVNIRYTSETYPPPTIGSPGPGASRGNRGSTMPPFARKLPQDPYFGASLVNQSNRESLSFGNTRPASAHGGSHSGRLPPGGLVGVIANTERARAIRRGSPTAMQAPFDSVSTGVAGPSVMTEQSAQIAQLTQAVMQQAQMMQQMIAMQPTQTQLQMQMQMPQLPGNLSLQSTIPTAFLSGSGIPRPASTSPTAFLRPQSQQGRAMSMLAPGNRMSFAPGMTATNRTSTLLPSVMQANNGNHRASYAASIAPSERSGVGPMRYRPVSMVPEEAIQANPRTSTISGPGQATAWQTQVAEAAPTPAKATPKAKAVQVEDEDAEWARVRAKRERKRGGGARSAMDGAAKEVKGLEGVYYPREEEMEMGMGVEK